MDKNNRKYHIERKEYGLTRPISISLTDHEIELLDMMAERLGLSRSGVIAFWIDGAQDLAPKLRDIEKLAKLFDVKLKKQKRRKKHKRI